MSSLSVEKVFVRIRIDPQRRPGELKLSELTELSAVLSSTGAEPCYARSNFTRHGPAQQPAHVEVPMIPPRNAVARRMSVLMAGLRCVAGIMGVLLVTLVYSCGRSAPMSPTPVTGTRDTRAGATAVVPGAAAAVSDSQSAVGIEAIGLPPDGSTLKATAPTVQSPNNGEVVGDLLRPTLTVLNARGRFVSTALQHRFEVWEVADDGTIILAAVGMADQTPNTTSPTVVVPLNQDTSYQWRVRAERNEFFGPWSGWGTFRTPVPVTIEVPLLWQPTNGTTVSSVRPVLEVANGEVSANAGAVTYEFQIATDFSFENVVATLAGELGAHTALPNTGVGVIGTHAQTQYTSVQPDFDLEYETTYYWRVRGTNEIVVTTQGQPACGRRVHGRLGVHDAV